MRVAVLQPSYLPWLGHLDQIARCDAFVFYDDVQFDRNGWRNRNRIRTDSSEGWSWLTVPALVNGFPKISEVTVDTRVPWRRKHAANILSAYAKAPFRSLFEEYLGAFYASTETNLANIAIASTIALMGALNISTPLYRSSEMDVAGDRNTRLLNICKHFDADEYLSGAAAQAYLDEDLFRANRIKVLWQQYDHPVYRQVRQPFISHLSALDALLNAGPSARDFVGNRPAEE